MLEKIRNNTESKIAKIILGIIIVPFALFGIDSYLSSIGSNIYVAKVNGVEISAQQYKNTEDRIREQMMAAGEKDQSLFESPAFKKAILENLISAELVNQSISSHNFTISDSQLSAYIVGMPDFQENGKFSQAKYDQIVKYNNMSPKKLEEQIRLDLAKQQIQASLTKLVYTPEEKLKPLINQAYQKRKVSLYELKLNDYIKKINPSEDDIKKVYDENKTSFIQPDKVKIEFLIYSVAGIVPSIKITDQEIQDYFEANKDKFKGEQERKVRHILFTFNAGITEAQKAEIKSKATETLNQLNKNPKLFSELAKSLSQDKETAKNGGSLGFISRGTMVKPFEDAVYNLSKNQLSDIVETEFGYHIIILDDIKGDEVTFASVKSQIKGELIYNFALNQYASNAEDFNDTVYEQPDNLEAAAKKFNLNVETSPWLSEEEAKKFFNNEALAKTIFDKETIESKKNTVAVEVSPNNLISARVIDFAKSAQKPIAEVTNDIKAFIVKRDSQQLLIDEGNKLVEELKKTSKKINWVDDLTVDKSDKQGLSDALITEIFRVDATTTPAYTGLYDTSGEFFVVKISHVDTKDVTDPILVDTYTNQYKTALENAIQAAYIDDLRGQSKIKINTKLLN